MPADFVEMVHKFERHTGKLQTYYTAGQATVYRWMDEAGIERKGTNCRPVPQDYTQLAPTMGLVALAKHYRTGEKTVHRWAEKTGVHPYVIVLRPAPSDWAELAPTMGLLALTRHYKTNHRIIKRWAKETGIEPKPYVPTPPKPRAPKSVRKVARIRPGDFQIARTRVTTIYDDAANTLRAYAAVYRCNDRGGFDERGKFWRMGNVVMTPSELLERAARYRKAA